MVGVVVVVVVLVVVEVVIVVVGIVVLVVLSADALAKSPFENVVNAPIAPVWPVKVIFNIPYSPFKHDAPVNPFEH